MNRYETGCELTAEATVERLNQHCTMSGMFKKACKGYRAEIKRLKSEKNGCILLLSLSLDYLELLDKIAPVNEELITLVSETVKNG
jgi:hypothetical protein